MFVEWIDIIAIKAVKELLVELGYPPTAYFRACAWGSPASSDEQEWHLEFADGQPGYFKIRVPKGLSGEETKEKIKHKIRERGITPSPFYKYAA
jgi:hypothetical protein